MLTNLFSPRVSACRDEPGGTEQRGSQHEKDEERDRREKRGSQDAEPLAQEVESRAEAVETAVSRERARDEPVPLRRRVEGQLGRSARGHDDVPQLLGVSD